MLVVYGAVWPFLILWKKYYTGGAFVIYVTGDTHGDFDRIAHFCARMKTKPSDIMIILGDAGINFYGGWRDHHSLPRQR